ncbi:transposase zinc-binding domain-containing protein [Rhizobium favelukesii]|uniref:transposase zinc-binding domain-containing protein n=1 Tax=Rhizobium favelukesii TaxID=348824 RepID=UPI00215FA5FA|nr:transposase zinc-binding domain-containing protein [Rhizobium favelukesii]MCS0462848.1 transposase zinc-binding domain-containing protein [Rhizobium favelukesii]
MRPAFEVADIFRQHGGSYRQENAGHLGRGERRVMGAIEACRTPRLGGHVDACDECGQRKLRCEAYGESRRVVRGEGSAG